MNGSQDPRQTYPGAPDPAYSAPPNVPPPAAPPVWPQNAYDARTRPVVEDPRRKSPSLALILSGMPGLGQIYVGYYQQGFIHMLVAGIVIFLLNAPGVHHRALEPFLGFFLAFFWLYNMIDAYRRASFYNHSLAGLTGFDVPEDIKLPKGSGSMAGGIALIGIGLLFFANTALGMSLDWLEQWWPMGLVLLGVYLVYASIAAKQRGQQAAIKAGEQEQPR